jgi:hypothetical protein
VSRKNNNESNGGKVVGAASIEFVLYEYVRAFG